ncbi:hypothetical protein Daus18300_011304 [Diaporthe australafricana]|uniref:Myb-like domain-containing protein n=1 Tax=Diaporthe australafricana TaxID=127596 RepID=A0ABR3W772_9PEZI
MSDYSKSPETPKKSGGHLNEKQTKLLVAMAQNTVGKVDYNWEQIAVEAGYKNVATAKTMYSRLLLNLTSNASKSPAEKGDAPIAGGPKTPSKVAKRTGKVGSSSAKKPHGKKSAAATDAGEEDSEKGDQDEDKHDKKHMIKPEADDAADAMMSGAL